MKEDIQRVVAKSVKNMAKTFRLTDTNFEVEVGTPKKKEFGDFSINTAMILANRMGKKPREVAELIIQNLPEEKEDLFKKIEIAGAGFINFFVKEEALVNKLNEIGKLGTEYGKGNSGNGEKVLLEFVSANPTGYLHVGHSRNAVVGDAIGNVLIASGYDVTKEFYINDAGRQMNLLGESLYARYMELFGRDAQIPEDGYKGDYIKELALDIKADKGDSLLSKPSDEVLDYCREYGRKRLLNEIKNDLESTGIIFDEWYSEQANIHSVAPGNGSSSKLDDVKDLLSKNNALEKKEGALWFKATEFGDSQDWVLVKSDGSPTYFFADIAYHLDKYERGFQNVINIWGADHHSHVSRLSAALRACGVDESRFNVVLIQFVRLMRDGQEVAMSKRSGNYVTMREVIDEVGSDVMRFFLLMRSSESHLDFDLDLAKKESSENPVYYIQYAHARINSLFNKAKENDLAASNKDLKLLTTSEEIDLVKHLLCFPEVIEDSAKSFSPHKLAYYLQDLASLFHVFYNKCRFVAF